MIVSGLLLHVCVCCCTCVRVAHVRFFDSRVVFVVARVGLVVARAIVACAICIRDVSQQQLCMCAVVWSVVVLCVLG